MKLQYEFILILFLAIAQLRSIEAQTRRNNLFASSSVRGTKNIPQSNHFELPKRQLKDNQQKTPEPTSSPTKSPTNKPTRSPTLSPTRVPTRVPSTSPPTSQPTKPPTNSPTATPTSPLTSHPTTAPTPVPTGPPTSEPTTSPTRMPSKSPMGSPATENPVHSPTHAPVFTATWSPTNSPVQTPVSTPTIAPTKIEDFPSIAPVAEENTFISSMSTFSFIITNGVKWNTLFADFEVEVTVAVQLLAVQILQDTFDDNSRRRLKVSLGAPVYFENVTEVGFTSNPHWNDDGSFGGGACPEASSDPNFDRCEVATAVIVLELDDSEVENEVTDAFKIEFDSAVESGQLDTILQAMDPSPPVIVVTADFALSTSSPASTASGSNGVDPSEKDNAGIYIGLAIVGGVFVALVPMLLVSLRRPKPEIVTEVNQDEEDDISETALAPPDEHLESDVAAVGKPIGGPMRNAIVPLPMNEQLGAITEEEHESSEAASLGTLESDFMVTAPPVLDFGSTGGRNVPESLLSGETKMHDIDAAIMAGDWSALGIAAKAMTSDVDSGSVSVGSMSKASNWPSSLDSVKATELEILIESGNWEGVADAAARYQADETCETDEETM